MSKTPERTDAAESLIEALATSQASTGGAKSDQDEIEHGEHLKLLLDELARTMGWQPKYTPMRALVGEAAYVRHLLNRERVARQLWAAAHRPMETVFRIADKKYRVGDHTIIVSKEQDSVIDALIEAGGAATLGDLVLRSGKERPDRLLKTALASHPALRSAITLPRRNGQGGYRTTIKRSSE